jgi:hypothetical protein
LSSVIVLCNNNLQSQLDTLTSTVSTNNTNTNNTLNSHQTQINTLSSDIVATNNNLQSQINILGGNTYQSQLDTLTSTVSTNNTNTNNTLNTKQNQINTLSSVIVLVNNNLQSQVNTITSTVSTNNTNTNNTLNSHQTQINTISSYVSTFSSYSNNYIGNIAYTGNVGIGGNLTIAGNTTLTSIITTPTITPSVGFGSSYTYTFTDGIPHRYMYSGSILSSMSQFYTSVYGIFMVSLTWTYTASSTPIYNLSIGLQYVKLYDGTNTYRVYLNTYPYTESTIAGTQYTRTETFIINTTGITNIQSYVPDMMFSGPANFLLNSVILKFTRLW